MTALLAALPPLPPPELTADAHRVTDLFRYATATTAIAFALATLALVVFVFRYRARPGHVASSDDGASPAARFATLALVALLFLAVDLVLVKRSRAAVSEWLTKIPDGPEVVRVEVLAQQWAWNVRYAGADGRFATPDDVVLLNEMVAPVGRPVVVNLGAKDVIHAFFVPELRQKVDAIPGRVNRLWFRPERAGTFEIACSQMCGWAHYRMRGLLRVVSEKEFAAWEAAENAVAPRKHDPAGDWGWEFRK